MTDILLDPLPTVWEGRAIDPDFRPMVWLSNQLRRQTSSDDPLHLANEALRRFYRDPVPPLEAPDAFAALERFYLAGYPPAASGKGSGAEASCEAIYDYAFDAPFIVAAFQQVYHIDLTAENLHWFRFVALFLALPEDTKMHRIMEIRQKDTSQMKDPERQRWEEWKELYALPEELKGGNRVATLEEREAAFIDSFS